MDGWTRVGSGRQPVFMLYVARSWSPSLETMERTKVAMCIHCEDLGRVAAIDTPGRDVSIDLVSPPTAESGWGSNVSSWLGPPCNQSKIIDLGRLDCASSAPGSWARATCSANRVKNPIEANPEAIEADVRSCRRRIWPNEAQPNESAVR
jgi:hypothetical protein